MQHKSKEKEFFDNWAAQEDYDVLTSYGYRAIINDFLRLSGARFSKGCKAIDLGCGTGVFTRKMFCGLNVQGYGLDISVNSIRKAQESRSGVRFMVGDIEHITFGDETFDVVIFSGVLHHFADITKCLKEGYRVLKKGGCMLSYDPNIRNPFMWLYRHESSPFYSRVGKTDNERLISAREVAEKMRSAGFSKINNHGISRVGFKFVKSRWGRCLLPFYNTADYLLGISPLAPRFGSFLICYGEKE